MMMRVWLHCVCHLLLLLRISDDVLRGDEGDSIVVGRIVQKCVQCDEEFFSAIHNNNPFMILGSEEIGLVMQFVFLTLRVSRACGTHTNMSLGSDGWVGRFMSWRTQQSFSAPQVQESFRDFAIRRKTWL